MHLVAISDLHGILPDIPPCDLLLLAGDLCPIEDHHPLFQSDWLHDEFRSWLGRVPARKIVGVAGNHDFIFEKTPHLVPRDLPWTYLQDSGVEWEGLKIYGSPWQPWFMDWAFNAGPEQLERIWQRIPDGTDILLLHGPPRGYGDVTRQGNSTGCPHLLERIKQVQPRLAVFGHIHEGRGEWELGRTKLANVTILDDDYRNVYPPWLWDSESSLR
jgi:predicted phosphohydrolase